MTPPPEVRLALERLRAVIDTSRDSAMLPKDYWGEIRPDVIREEMQVDAWRVAWWALRTVPADDAVREELERERIEFGAEELNLRPGDKPQKLKRSRRKAKAGEGNGG